MIYNKENNEISYVKSFLIPCIISFVITMIIINIPIPVTITEHILDYEKTIQTENVVRQTMITHCYGLIHYITGSCFS